MRRLVASAWLSILFFLAPRSRWLLRMLKPAGVFVARRFSRQIRISTDRNARRIFGPEACAQKITCFSRGVVGNFFDFVLDVGSSASQNPQSLRDQIEEVTGRDAYVARRKRGGGAIIVTAHMGSFEVGLASLREVEPEFHVVFKRDANEGFERIRSSLRKQLGVLEAPIDEGWPLWMRLRRALMDNQVVVMQGDRAMPGQKAQAVPVLHGHLLLPLGPVKLARASGCPIIPVFTIRTKENRFRLFVETPIEIDPDAEPVDGIDPALLQIGRVLEKYIAAYPEQWLMLEPAFVEDADALRPGQAIS